MKIKGDGNCFYRALARTLGYEEDNFQEVKILLYDFLTANRKVFDYLSNIEQLENTILKDKEPAPYEVIYIAVECF